MTHPNRPARSFAAPAVTAAAALLVAASLLAPPQAAAQARPHADLQDAYFAWDAGDYLTAMERYLEVLTGPGGDAHTREAALLTGELHPVREVDDDGRNLSVSPDGRFLAWERQLEGGWVTRIEAVDGTGDRTQLEARGAALSGTGKAAWVDGDWIRIRSLDTGDEVSVEVDGILPVSVTFAPDRDELFLVAGREGHGDRLHVFRLAGPDWAPRLLELGEGHVGNPMPAAGGRHLVFTRLQNSPLPVPEGQTATGSGEPQVGVLDLGSGAVERFPGGAPHVGRGGDVLAFLQPTPEGATRIMAVRLSAGGIPAPTLLVETDLPVANPAVSPDGERVAFQGRPHLDWEIFVVPTAGGEAETQVTREIQHDLFPAWVTDRYMVAMKGEARHRRAHLHDLETGEDYELFHNNTLRTIAPQYQWVVDPTGSGVFVNAERDGNTISPERAVYWIDLTREVTHQDVVARVQANFEAERELLERGRTRFAPRADEIRAVADAVSVGRVHHYADALYRFGTKFFTEPGNDLAREYLAETLESWGYEAELQWFEARGQQTANVVATLRGTENPEQVYVISSHFDSVLRSPGGDDNSSGTTALLEAARVLAQHPRKATIQFAFLTAEEAGLLGAREFVRRAQEDGVHIAGVLNNDMIGWTRSHRLDNTIRYSNDGIRDLQHAAANLFSDLITYDSRYYRGTDAAVFFDAYGDIVGGIGSYPVLGNPNYHQSTDELWTINHRLVAEVSRTTVATIMLLADGPSRVSGLRVAQQNDGIHLEWDPAPEAAVVDYRVRAQRPDGSWVDLDPVTEPRARVPSGLNAEVVEVWARYADGTVSFDGARLSRDEW